MELVVASRSSSTAYLSIDVSDAEAEAGAAVDADYVFREIV